MTVARRWLPRVAAHAGLVAISALALLPLAYLLLTALKTQAESFLGPWRLPAHPTLANFRAALEDGQFSTWLANSAKVSAGATVATTLVSLLAAFALARMRFRGRGVFIASCGVLLGVSPVVILVPLFVLATRLRLVDSLPGIVVIYTGLLTPFTVYLLVGFVRLVSAELIDAARIDGAGSVGVLRHVVVPLIRPALATAALVVLLTVWNDLLFALVFLPSDSHKTVMAGLTLFESRSLANEPLVDAGTLIAALPMVAVYSLGFRLFERGLMAGALR